VLDRVRRLPLGARREARIHVEHLEVLSDDDVTKLGLSGVTASMQPLHMQWRAGDGSDNWATRLGAGRNNTGFRTRSVLRSGARLVLGSDWPVASYDPRVGMAWARHRGDPRDAAAPVFEPEERLTGEEALLAYTLWPAQARGHADRGHLSVGAVGDLTIWDGDPVEAEVTQLVSLPIRYTIVDGHVVHEMGEDVSF
jgi:predicted amidohydrolase YtcJ